MSQPHHDWKQQAAHFAHVALHTETGKNAVKAVAGTVAATATAVLGPTAVAVAAPVVVVGAIGYCIWSLFND